MSKDSSIEKHKLRSLWKERRKKISLNSQDGYEKSFIKNFKKAVGTFRNKIIAGYNPIDHEVNCLNLLNFASKEGSKIALPYTNENKVLEFREWHFDEPLKKDTLGILSPSSKKIVIPDVIIIPLLCFDLNGTRLGMGLGIYDRSLPFYELSDKYGLAFSNQKTKKLIKEEHDFLIDGVITEKNFLSFERKKN
jgi:5-formyltetrahydrofolate cyclo-ligase